jgi:hypothetical protein
VKELQVRVQQLEALKAKIPALPPLRAVEAAKR